MDIMNAIARSKAARTAGIRALLTPQPATKQTTLLAAMVKERMNQPATKQRSGGTLLAQMVKERLAKPANKQPVATVAEERRRAAERIAGVERLIALYQKDDE